MHERQGAGVKFKRNEKLIKVSMDESLIFKDPKPLDDSYIPDVLKAREAHVREVASSLSSYLSGGSPLHVLIFGRPGTGKTALAQQVLSKVEEEGKARTAYINCWEQRTLYGIAESLRLQLRVLFAERSETAHKLDRVKKVLGGKRLVLVFDEIDRMVPLERDNVLYTFMSWGNVALICVANSRDFLISLEQRVLSRFTPVHIECGPYAEDDIFQILADRAEAGLRSSSYDDALLRQIAASAEGDARLAIAVLRRVGQLSEAARSASLKVEEVARAFSEMKLVRRKYLLDRLTPHHRIIVEIVERYPGTHSQALREAYEFACTERDLGPVALRTFTSYVERLVQLKLVKSEPKSGDGTARVFSSGSGLPSIGHNPVATSA